MTRSTIALTILSAPLVAAAGLSGCASDVSYASVRGNLTPEMRGVTDTIPQAQAWESYMVNLNSRMINDDWNRAWYWDHPSRLDPRPVLDVSGNPR
jgi:hypothetical protein